MPATRVTLKLQVNVWRKKRLEPLLRENLEEAGEFLENEVKQDVSTPYPPASSPGHPPHMRTGDYRQSIEHIVDESRSGNSITMRVGSNSPYGRRLEFGFVGRDSLGRNVSQAPRPHMRPAIQRNRSAIGRIIAQGGFK